MPTPRCIAFAALGLLLATAPALAGPTVLIIWDLQGPQTEALAKALTDSSLKVVLSQTDETGWDGTNPPLAGVDVVVHLNGLTFQAEMPLSGQKALERFVRDGGGYIHHEWSAYELGEGRMQWMRNLILFDRASGYVGPMTITRVKEQASHPVVWEIPPSFQMNCGSNIGKVHVFAEDPAVVLARDDRDNDAIAVREFGLGRIVGFHHAGNWNASSMLLDSRDARRLFVDAVLWAHGCGEVYRKGPRQAVCEKIAARRAEPKP
jgi:hypothetical protein